jgi:hypothetical protein
MPPSAAKPAAKGKGKVAPAPAASASKSVAAAEPEPQSDHKVALLIPSLLALSAMIILVVDVLLGHKHSVLMVCRRPCSQYPRRALSYSADSTYSSSFFCSRRALGLGPA